MVLFKEAMIVMIVSTVVTHSVILAGTDLASIHIENPARRTIKIAGR